MRIAAHPAIGRAQDKNERAVIAAAPRIAAIFTTRVRMFICQLHVETGGISTEFKAMRVIVSSTN
jgi:hypothetical protein